MVAWILNIHRRMPDMKRKAMLGGHCLGLDEKISLMVWTEEIIATARSSLVVQARRPLLLDNTNIYVLKKNTGCTYMRGVRRKKSSQWQHKNFNKHGCNTYLLQTHLHLLPSQSRSGSQQLAGWLGPAPHC